MNEGYRLIVFIFLLLVALRVDGDDPFKEPGYKQIEEGDSICLCSCYPKPKVISMIGVK